MKIKFKIAFLLVVTFCFSKAFSQKKKLELVPQKSIDQRVDSILKLMTVQEKLAQMTQDYALVF